MAASSASASAAAATSSQLHNVVATCHLAAKLDLRRIAEHATNTEHQNKRSKEALVMRILRPRELRCTATVFGSGNVRVMGTRSVESARTAARRIARAIQKAGHDVRFTKFEVQTVMASRDLGFPVHLERLKFVHSHHCTYEPELSPSLVYRMTGGAVLNIFGSGKVMITKVRSAEEVQRAFDEIYPVLQQFRKESHVASASEQEALASLQQGDAEVEYTVAKADYVANAVLSTADVAQSNAAAKADGSRGRSGGRGRGRGRGRARGSLTKPPPPSASSMPSPKPAQLSERKKPLLDDELLGSDDDVDEPPPTSAEAAQLPGRDKPPVDDEVLGSDDDLDELDEIE